jgi:hypothetical protein
VSAYNDYQLSSFVDQIFERLRAIEAQLARRAIRKYRELTGAEVEAAKEAIAKL